MTCPGLATSKRTTLWSQDFPRLQSQTLEQKPKAFTIPEPLKTLIEKTLRRWFSKRGTDKICSTRQTLASMYYPAGAGVSGSTEEIGRARARAFMGLHLGRSR